jgi:hypothetical protein
MHAPSKSSQKHGKNASQNMRKGQNLQTAPSKPCIKKSPTSFKKPGFIVFKAQMRNPNFPQDLASFWDQIPLQMAKNPQKTIFWA